MTARKVGEHVEIDQEEARAGRTGMHVRQIMTFSIALVVIGFGLAAFFWFN
ncbi:MAG TPA: hypothetical protein PLS69_03035 [Terricaulis sp.]|nr:hypothetical protein [Terricaulis sp.]HRP11521.1 hypothetical protein [Terricaulis sp.]